MIQSSATSRKLKVTTENYRYTIITKNNLFALQTEAKNIPKSKLRDDDREISFF